MRGSSGKLIRALPKLQQPNTRRSSPLSAHWISSSLQQVSILGSGFLLAMGLSLAGGAHCALMCGGIAQACGGTHRRSMFSWQLGRLVSYLILGALAGLLGGPLTDDRIGTSLSRWVAGGILSTLLFGLSLRPKSNRGPGLWMQLSLIARRQPAILGLLMGGIPCGWLWSFLALAASGGTVLWGIMILFALWLGSLPALLAAPWMIAHLLRPLHRWIPHPRPWVIGISLALALTNLVFHFIGHPMHSDLGGASQATVFCNP